MNHRTIRQFHHSLFFGLQQRLIFTNNNNYATITITTAGNRHFSSLNNNNNNNDVKQKHLSLRLYRVLQRYIRDDIISSSNNNYNTLLLQPPLDPRQLGQAQILSIPSSDNDKETTKNKSDYILQFFLTQSSKDNNNNDDDDDQSNTDSSIWVNTTVLKDTLRQVFKNTYNDNNDPLGQQHQKAIDAIRTWKEQIHMWNHCTTVTNNENYGIRVIATSRYIGTTRSNANNKINENLSHHFSYKIRIQCLRYPIPNDENMVVQLLGRTWYIQEEEEKKSPTFPFSTKDDDDDDDDIIKLSKDVVSIDAPTTGAVGHLPVIRPGESFEYDSKCELGTKKGSMRGWFHMALVPAATKSAQVGDPIDVLLNKDDEEDEIFFKVPVGPFTLTSEDF